MGNDMPWWKKDGIDWPVGNQERYLLEQLTLLHKAHQDAAKPFVAQLAKIRSRQQPI